MAVQMEEPQFRIYQSEAGTYRWMLVAPTGRKIAESGEAFETQDAAIEALERVKHDVTGAAIVDAPPVDDRFPTASRTERGRAPSRTAR